MRLYFVNKSTCAAEISQPVPFQTVKLGDSATIECHIKSDLYKRVWYKFTTEKGLQLVAAFNNFFNRSIFPGDSQHHYSVKFDIINSHLSISAITWEDVGTYFCGVTQLNEILYGSGTFLIDSGVQQRESEPVQPGDSVTLSCSVHTGRCAGEHISVTWLKNSHHSAPQMIYYSGNKSCQRTESGETSCVYELLLRNLSSDDAGTFYCVLTSCGQTLFGNGTRIIVHISDLKRLCNSNVKFFFGFVLLNRESCLIVMCKPTHCLFSSAEKAFTNLDHLTESNCDACASKSSGDWASSLYGNFARVRGTIPTGSSNRTDQLYLCSRNHKQHLVTFAY
uniref:Novel immune-type receptor 8 n=1 Tax=Sander lucioperca TaxID=283035 RepID=A0A8C9YVK3_SANLU